MDLLLLVDHQFIRFRDPRDPRPVTIMNRSAFCNADILPDNDG